MVDKEQPTPKSQCQALLTEVEGANAEQFPAVGMGEDVRLSAANLSGAALTVGGEVLHLCTFHVSSDQKGGSSRSYSHMTRASRRATAH